MENKYLISEYDLRKLLTSDAKLGALLSGGVDNWEYFGEALYSFLDECEYEGFEDYVDKVMEKYSDKKVTNCNHGIYICKSEVEI